VLAYVSHSSAEADPGDLCLDAGPPAASVFKLVTAAALLENGVGEGERVCYRGGGSRLSLGHLTSDASSSTCATLAEAIGRSINPVMASLADAHLDAATLGRYASAFGFGEALPFDVATRPSEFEVPDDRLERARMAAGFWHTHLSPLHGALIAATIANGGRMPRASLVDQVLDAEGHVVHEHVPETFRSVIGASTAAALTRMMERTVTEGTSRRAFHDDRGRPFLPGVDVAGKTGTLSEERPYRGYTWWVGFAPTDAPTIALAVVLINRPEWRIKASDAARFALEHWLVARPARSD
jgi:cell division protein FtsI/penicillin-binding protein 2